MNLQVNTRASVFTVPQPKELEHKSSKFSLTYISLGQSYENVDNMLRTNFKGTYFVILLMCCSGVETKYELSCSRPFKTRSNEHPFYKCGQGVCRTTKEQDQ